jgi:hypothetical protein
MPVALISYMKSISSDACGQGVHFADGFSNHEEVKTEKRSNHIGPISARF